MRRWQIRVVGLFVLVVAGRFAGSAAWAEDECVAAATGHEAASKAAALAYTEAAREQNQGRYDAAVQRWRQWLLDFPTDPLAAAARHYLGVCLLQLQEFGQAATEFQTVIQSDAEPELLEETYVNLGWAHYMLGVRGDRARLQQAARLLADHAQRFPDGRLRDQSLFYRAESLYEIGEMEQATACYERLIAEHPQSELRPVGLYALATCRREQGQLSLAKDLYDRFLGEYEDHAFVGDVLLGQALVCLQSNDPAAASGIFARAANVKDFEAADQATFQQACCLASLGKYLDAAELYARLATEYPQSKLVPAAQLEAGRCYCRAERWQAAADWLTQACRSDDSHTLEAAHELSRAQLHLGKPDLAQQAAEKALQWAERQEHPDDDLVAAVKLDRADSLSQQAVDVRDTVAAYLDVAQSHPQSPSAAWASYRAIRATHAAGNYQRACDLASQFLTRYADHPLTRKVLLLQADSACLAGNVSAAEQIYRQLLAGPESEDQWTLRLKLGQTLFLQQKYEACARTLVESAPRLPSAAVRAKAWFLLGTSQLQQQTYDSAIESLSASLVEEPRGKWAPQVCRRLVEALIASKRLDDARLTLERTLDAFPDDEGREWVMYRLAKLAGDRGDWRTAESRYAELTCDFPDSPLVPGALMAQARGQLQRQEYARAEATLTRLLQRDPDLAVARQAYKLRALCRQALGDQQGGLADVVELLQRDPPADLRSDALLIRSLCQTELQQCEAATATLQSIVQEAPQYPLADRVWYLLGWNARLQSDDLQAEEHFLKVARDYPASAYAAEANFHLGQAACRENDFQAAVPFYQAAKKAGRDDQLREKATYQLGWCQFQLQDYASAQATFSEQLQWFSEGSLATDGRLMLAECCFHQAQYEPALDQYGRLRAIDSLAETSQALLRLHAGQAANQLQRWPAAEAWLAEIPRPLESPEFMPQVYLELGLARSAQQKWSAAEDALAQAVRSSQGEIGAHARYELGRMYAQQAQLGRAIREFQTLMYGYGGDSAPPEIQQWQARAGLQAGQCAASLALETRQPGDSRPTIARAEKFFRYVVQRHHGTAAADEAAQRLVELTPEVASAKENETR